MSPPAPPGPSDRPDELPRQVSRWILAVGVLAVLLFLVAAVLWEVRGGLDGLADGGAWVAELGSEEGPSKLLLVVVGEATLLAALFYIVLMTAEGVREDRPLVRISIAGALLLALEGALLASIGWVAVPHIGDAQMTADHPFVKTVELLMVLRTHISIGGGSLIGIGVAWAALRALRQGTLPKPLLFAGVGAGALALVGGALLLLGLGAAVHTVGVVGSIAWTGTRSGLLTYRAARDRA